MTQRMSKRAWWLAQEMLVHGTAAALEATDPTKYRAAEIIQAAEWAQARRAR